MSETRDAVATLEFAILNAIVNTCGKTGVRPGPACDALVQAISLEIRSDVYSWVLQELSNPDEAFDSGQR